MGVSYGEGNPSPRTHKHASAESNFLSVIGVTEFLNFIILVTQ
jgi:hypothetical protein